MIDWTNPKDKVSKYFTVKECLWLPQWNRMATEADGLDDTIKANLIDLCHAMDYVRELVGPISVHCCYRPEEYNKLVKGAKNSAHKFGMAMDYSVYGKKCDDIRALLETKLAILKLRMERMPGGNWIHNDRKTPINGNWYFNP